MKEEKGFVNISNISRIRKDSNSEIDNFPDDDEIAIFQTLMSKTTSRKAHYPKINSTPSFQNQFLSYKCLSAKKPLNSNKNSIFKLKDNKNKEIKQIKSLTTSIFKSSSNVNVFNNNNIHFTPITSFLSKEDVYKISDAQTEYIHELDSLYRSKIQKINEVHNNYDKELLMLKENIEESKKDDIYYLVYNLVLKDMNEELKDIEEEFAAKKNHALFLYYSRGKKLKERFCEEIGKCFNDIKREIEEKIKSQK